ncbi:MAG: T9SS type A sorting domain-containing protein [Paludibacter sp.]
MKKYFKILLICSLTIATSQLALSQSTTLVSIDANGKLTYKPDSKGTVIPDFSGVGYQNSEKPIPFVPVVKTLTAVVGDNVANVQAAINEVAAMPLVNGIRGAILFKAGTYELSTTINVTASGIVLRGEGQSTIFKATGTVQYDLIHIIGASGKTDITSSQKMVTDAFVPVGVKSVTVQSVQPFAVGDWVHFRREPNDAWIHMLGMDTLSKIDPLATNWTASGYKISFERKILSIQGNILTFDAPVMDIIDPVYASAFVVKFTSGRISNCAVENLKMTSTYTSSTDELHGWNAIYMDNVENCWVKNVVAYWFGYSCVNVNDGGAFVTVDSCSMIDPISIITGGRRYSFNLNGQRCLVQNCTTRNGRHDFVDGSRTPGPNVFYNSTATQEHADIGPHHRWSTGILIDNVSTDGQIRVQDRADSGSGHGWSGAQIMFWNCTSPDFVVQDPPSYHCNWAIGCVGPITNVGQWTTNPLGIVESKGTKITAIPSLFKAQLAERLKNLTTSVEIPKVENADFQVFPNPATNQIEVKLTLNKSSKIKLNLTDLSGKSIKSLLSNQLGNEGVNSYKFNTSNIKSGVYFIQFTSETFQKHSKLIISN